MVKIGAHVDHDAPLAAAKALGVEIAQIFNGKPQGWEKPPPRDDAAELRDSDVDLYIHAPYLINVCSPKPNIRHGSRKILSQQCEAAAELGAVALIVHPGHAEDGIDEGVKRWASTLERLESDVPVYLENTAGGDHAVARRVDALAKLWEAVTGADHGRPARLLLRHVPRTRRRRGPLRRRRAHARDHRRDRPLPRQRLA